MECQQCLEENKRSIAEKGYGLSNIKSSIDCEIHNNTNKAINVNNNPYNLKWTDGQPYERSRRMKHQIQMENEEFSKKMETTAYSTSLNHDENTWDILNQGLYNNDFRQSSKREDLDCKIAGRDLVQQCGYNPFMENSNYADDISVSNQFLQPQNTTIGREKAEQGNS